MSTVQRPNERYVDFDEYVDYQLEKARAGIKSTDILTAAAGVGALVIGYLVAFVVADHWLFEGGVPRALRWSLLAAVAVVAVAWLAWKVVLPYVRRVNDLYAARMLEQAEPSLRGTLFGLVDARRGGRPPVEEVRRALEKRAAKSLAEIDPDAAIDRRPLMRAAYALLAVVLVACGYAVFSPKRVGPSLMRALAPTAGVGVATRTEILGVKPGDAAVLAGTTLEVSVTIRGEAPERVMLYFSTADRRFADEPVELRLHDDSTREYRGALVGDAGRGLTQDLTYRVEANDDSAGPFSVKVEQPPAATVESVALQFPAYTGLEPTTSDAPPIDAIEGTSVTLVAKANRRLKAAKLVFADDERFVSRNEEVPLRIAEDGVTLTAVWKLAIRNDATSPTFYRIECRDADGKSNPNPAVYPIAIRPDKPPEVVLHDPKSDLERPANAVVPLMITAADPDFRLREVTLRMEKNGQDLPERNVLWEGAEREVAVRHDWDLGRLLLKPGDVITYYVQARDNREPEFNRRNTPKLKLTITEPASKQEVQQQLADDRARQDQELAANEAAAERPDQSDAGDAEEPVPGGTDPRDGERQQDQLADAGEQQPGSGERPQENEAGGDGEKSPSRVKNDGTQDDEVIRKLLDRQQKEREQGDPTQERQESQQGEDEEGGESQPQAGGEGDKGPGQKGEGQGGKGRSPKGGREEADPQGPNRQDGEQSNESQPGEAAGGESQDRKGQGQSGNQGAGGRKTRPDGQTDARPGEASGGEPGGGTTESQPGENGDAGREEDASGQRGETGRGQKGEGGGQDGRSDMPSGGDPGSDDGEPRQGSADGAKPTEGDNASGANPRPAAGERPDGRQGETAAGPPGDAGATRQGERNGAGSPDAANGERSGDQPQPSDGDPNGEPAGSDDERTASDPGRPNGDGQPRGATERNPGEGRPDQRSEQPDSGEQGTGEPNADGTPDGAEGPGDAGTRPGDRQAADQSTGRQGAGRDGRPENDRTREGQPQSGDAGAGGQQPAGRQAQPRQQPGGRQGEGNPSGRSGENQDAQAGQQGEPQGGQAGQPGESQGAPGEQAQRSGQGGQGGRESEQEGTGAPQDGGESGGQSPSGESEQGGQEGGSQGEPGGQDQPGQQDGQKGQPQGDQQGQGGKGQPGGEQAGQGGQKGQGGQPGGKGGASGKGGNQQGGRGGQGGTQSAGGGGRSEQRG